MQNFTNPRNHNLLYQSSYDRGLEILLDLWPRIIKKFPDATLSIAYGWNTFVQFYRDNPERMKWKEKMEIKMKQAGVHHYGRLGKQILKQIRKHCGIWSYPTFFAEINCISGLECQEAGLVPVTMNSFALKETIGSGSKVEGDIYDDSVKELWLKELFKYMSDEKLWKKESEKAQNFAKDYSWTIISQRWLDQL